MPTKKSPSKNKQELRITWHPGIRVGDMLMTFKYESKETKVELNLEANEMIAMLKESGSEFKDLITIISSPDFIPGICKIAEMVHTNDTNKSKMRFENDMAMTKFKAEHEEKMQHDKHTDEMELEKLRADSKLEIEKLRAEAEKAKR